MNIPKQKICSVCKKEVKSPIQWWDEPYNACSDCVRKAVLEIQKDEKQNINWFDTPQQRRRYGDFAVNIMSRLMGKKPNFKNFGIEIDIMPETKTPNKKNKDGKI